MHYTIFQLVLENYTNTICSWMQLCFSFLNKNYIFNLPYKLNKNFYYGICIRTNANWNLEYGFGKKNVRYFRVKKELRNLYYIVISKATIFLIQFIGLRKGNFIKSKNDNFSGIIEKVGTTGLYKSIFISVKSLNGEKRWYSVDELIRNN